MAFTELAFEQFLIALEATRLTAESSPTHLITAGGKIKPTKTVRKAKEARGTLALNYRGVVTAKGGEWETMSEEADLNTLLAWLNVFVAPVTTPTTPASGVLTRDWAFVRSITSDNRKTFTGWFGDANIQVFRHDGCFGTELTLAADATADDGVLTFKAKGSAGPATKVSDPTVPAAIAGVLIPAATLQCFMDTSSAIGTTEITGRVLSAEHTIRTGMVAKRWGAGPTATLGHTGVGVQAVSAITTKIRMEVPDMTQFDGWAANTSYKTRMVYNGAAIETVSGPITYYNSLTVDTYGPIEVLDLGENAGSNRVYELTIEGYVDSTLASDLRVMVRCERTTL